MSDPLRHTFITESHQYVAEMRKKLGEGASRSGNDLQDLHLDYHHPLEDHLDSWWMRMLMKWLVQPRQDQNRTRLEDIFSSYNNPQAPIGQRALYWPLHRFMDRMRGESSREEFKKRIATHGPVLRGLVLTARSLIEHGLRVPQRFSYPLFVVWNITNKCNLKCRHCYQSAGGKVPDELTRDEKLAIIDQFGKAYLPMMAFAGGAPTMCDDLIPVLQRCKEWGIHTTIATNGTRFTPELAQTVVDAGVKYVEVSLDAVDPEKHNAFRGIPGIWDRTVAGMKVIADTPGVRLGVAMCVHRDNYDQVRDMIEFAISIKASCFAYFNFIPVGRGTGMTDQDITPGQRETLLEMLNEYIQGGRIGIISTCPQFGRVSLAHSPIYSGKIAPTHCGSGSGVKARVIAKYLGGCGAGRTYACVEPNGDVTPCVYMPHRTLGNLREKTLKEIIDGSPLWDVLNDRDTRGGHCGACSFRYFCGGCRARADAYYQDPAGPDPGCVFNYHEWDKLVDRDHTGAIGHPATSPTSAVGAPTR